MAGGQGACVGGKEVQQGRANCMPARLPAAQLPDRPARVLLRPEAAPLTRSNSVGDSHQRRPRAPLQLRMRLQAAPQPPLPAMPAVQREQEQLALVAGVAHAERRRCCELQEQHQAGAGAGGADAAFRASAGKLCQLERCQGTLHGPKAGWVSGQLCCRLLCCCGKQRGVSAAAAAGCLDMPGSLAGKRQQLQLHAWQSRNAGLQTGGGAVGCAAGAVDAAAAAAAVDSLEVAGGCQARCQEHVQADARCGRAARGAACRRRHIRRHVEDRRPRALPSLQLRAADIHAARKAHGAAGRSADQRRCSCAIGTPCRSACQHEPRAKLAQLLEHRLPRLCTLFLLLLLLLLLLLYGLHEASHAGICRCLQALQRAASRRHRTDQQEPLQQRHARKQLARCSCSIARGAAMVLLQVFLRAAGQACHQLLYRRPLRRDGAAVSRSSGGCGNQPGLQALPLGGRQQGQRA